MRKIQVAALSTVVALGAMFTSCGGNITTDVPLNNANDSISYAFGGMLSEQGVMNYLGRLGVITDTLTVKMSYQQRINTEPDEQIKETLRKELSSKIDSIETANKRNIAEFLKGFNDGVNSPASKSAYYAGLSFGDNISKQSQGLSDHLYGPNSTEKINKDAVAAAVVASITNKKLKIEAPSVIFNTKMEEIQAEKMKEQYGVNLEAGQKFLEENKSKEGVVTLPNGLQYKVLKEGNGAKPTANDIVEVHYHGTLIDGTVFDSSIDRNKTQTFNVSGVIRGWTEILQMMPVGSKWTVYVPYDLAYGSQDRGTIKPFSALVFDIELLDIKKQ